VTRCLVSEPRERNLVISPTRVATLPSSMSSMGVDFGVRSYRLGKCSIRSSTVLMPSLTKALARPGPTPGTNWTASVRIRLRAKVYFPFTLVHDIFDAARCRLYRIFQFIETACESAGRVR